MNVQKCALNVILLQNVIIIIIINHFNCDVKIVSVLCGCQTITLKRSSMGNHVHISNIYVVCQYIVCEQLVHCRL